MYTGRLCVRHQVFVVCIWLCFVAASSEEGQSCHSWSTLEQQQGFGGIAEMAQQATFAAGCFWSVELAFQRVPGVTKTSVGYTQGKTANPTYEQVCSGRSGHAEAVLVEYNPSELSYDQLLDTFWKKHDPTQLNRQGNDVGSQYRSGIYYHTPEQQTAATASYKSMENKLGKKIATEVLPAKEFYPAEDYHQQYLEKGGRGGRKQSAKKGCSDPIRCYG